MENPLYQPAFVLVRPQMGENIGAAARAMLNFGLQRMRIVAPRDGWPNPAAVAMASGAGRVLDGAETYETTRDAIADCHFVFATTARPRGLVKDVVTPEDALAMTHAMMAEGKKVGFLFGPERSGLENDDIALANVIVTVPVNPEFASLNLGQSVLLIAYEWMRQKADAALKPAGGGFEAAESIEVQKLGDHFEDRLQEVGFFYPEDKAAGMKLNLRNMWSRLTLTRGDVQILHGMLRQIFRKR